MYISLGGSIVYNDDKKNVIKLKPLVTTNYNVHSKGLSLY